MLSRCASVANGAGRHSAAGHVANAGTNSCGASGLYPIEALPMSPGVIEVEFSTGARLRICGPVDAPIVAAVMQALADCEWRG